MESKYSMRNKSMAERLDAHLESTSVWAQCQKDDVLFGALVISVAALERAAAAALTSLVTAGGLLFAWHGSTAVVPYLQADAP